MRDVDEQNLVWLDLEMTGLHPEVDKIIEIATLVTDKDLNIIAQGPVLAIAQSDTVLEHMDEWNQKHHGESGLIERVRQSHVDEAQAVAQTLDFLKDYVSAGVSPLCGNTIGQDRRFLRRYMPELDQYFHYRSIDVSTVKELTQRWAPDVLPLFTKKNTHQALDDIRESVEELRFYRQQVFKI
tara:strand:+ start:3485 stop:4033 length:549 start_codon:yes stop_codon:yes gene_type:complete